MSTCNGNGECLIQCECECYDKETDEVLELCVCGHREHNGYCPSNCCSPIECINYKYCNVKLPKWVTFCNNGKCINCDVKYGKHTISNKVEECCVCFENKILISLKCNHRVCNDCWNNITNNIFKSNEGKPLCPLCRNVNDWIK